jgi:4'-phosphopantetheinyl transferase
MRAINAVVLETPASLQQLVRRERAEGLSNHARIALRKSAELSGIALEALQKGDRGQPVPVNGNYWTLSHTIDYVAAAVAPYPIGIDIERIGPFTSALQAKVAGPDEWEIAADADERTFCRIWTAKEAVLKAVGKGLAGLSRCKVTEIVDENQTRIEYGSEKWIVSHYYGASDHVASITAPAGDVVWRL